MVVYECDGSSAGSYLNLINNGMKYVSPSAFRGLSSLR